ncbi:MAG: MerR family transcriptional regulator [Oliverpabstia sp.]|nr:MerR family transcriptional regulator [Oliverpabstia sp.]
MEKYFKIGEIAQLYGIGVDSIRYYEEIGLIKPERSESGYRHYSIHDIWRLNVIRDLRSIGFTMEQIKEYLDHHNAASSLKLLEEEQKTIHKQMLLLQQLQKNVEHRLHTIRSALSLPLNEITQVTLPPRWCHSLSEGYSAAEEMDLLMKRLLNLDKKRLYIIGSNQMGTVISLSSLLEKKELSYQSVFLIDEQGENCIPGGDYLCVTYRGSYTQSIDWGWKLIRYAHDHNMTVAGDMLEVLWLDIHTSSDESEFITQLQLPVQNDSRPTE